MTAWTRRAFGGGLVAASLPFAPPISGGQAKPRVVVVGGGIGGATVAKYLAASIKAIDVTIVEPKTRYTTCVFSNLYLAGMRSFESLTHGYEALTNRYGIKLVHDLAVAIDSSGRRVHLKGGSTLVYDRLVVSSGIAFDDAGIDGYDDATSEIFPHAWCAGPQTKLLRAQLESMDDGGTFVMTVPRNPYRCPVGPYERASLAAYFLKQFKPRSKVLILDAKASFVEQELFQDGWNRHYPGMIDWLPVGSPGGIEAVDIKARSIRTAGGSFKANVANVIPSQIASGIARESGLADKSRWCPVDPFTFESKLQPDIHVIGDSADSGDMPKSASSANSQAKVCAFAIAAALAGTKPEPPLLFDAGFSHLAGDDAVSEASSFTPIRGTIKKREIAVSKVGEAKETRRRAVQQADGWYDAFTHDVFG